MQTSRAALLTGHRTIQLREFPIRPIGDDEILLKVEGCGICGTDVHEYKGDPFGLIPVVLGHEGTGEVVAKGRNVGADASGNTIHLGDKLVTSILTSEATLRSIALAGRPNLAPDLGVYGLISDDETHLNGYFADYLIIRPGSNVFVVNDMSLDQRMLSEPAAVVVHSLERAKSTGLLNFGSRVLVQGCGPIGLLQIAILRTYGIQNIIALDGNTQRLEMARRLGATECVDFRELEGVPAITEKIKSLTQGRGVDFAFQVTGVPAAAGAIWKYVRRGGGLCEVGFFVDNGDCVINPHQDLCQKEITAVGSWVYTVAEYPIAFDFLRRAAGIGLPVTDLITHRFPLTELQEAMETNIRLEGIKVVVIP